MAKTTYKLSNFDSTSASQGVLCVMVAKTFTQDTITNVPIVWEEGDTSDHTQPFGGAGICRLQQPANFIFIVNSVLYIFNEKGLPVSLNAKNYVLKLGEVVQNLSTAGNAVETSSTTNVTRGSNGEIINVNTTDGDSSVIVSVLEARDQFAMQALKTLMERFEKDPATISDNEMAFLCEQAYQWAANMMTQASKARATVTTESSGGSGSSSGGTTGTTVDSSELTDTTDKLLNNIVAALEKTDESEGSGENIKYSERVSIPKLIEWLNNYSKHTPENVQDTQTTVGLEDLIKAIKAINVDMDTTALVTAINNTHTNNIGSAGLGRDADHPLHISGGGFPSRGILTTAFTAENTNAAKVIHDFLTFNTAGAVGYSTNAEVKKLILGYLNNYANITGLAAAVLTNMIADDVYNKIASKVLETANNRAKAWLEAARVTINGTTYSLTVNTPT